MWIRCQNGSLINLETIGMIATNEFDVPSSGSPRIQAWLAVEGDVPLLVGKFNSFQEANAVLDSIWNRLPSGGFPIIDLHESLPEPLVSK